MAFRTNPAPYQRAKNSTLRIMLILCAALAIVWICGIVYSFKLDGIIKSNVADANPHYGLKAILMVLLALATTAAWDVITTLIKHKKDSKESLGKEILHDLVYNYSYVTALIFALTLPVYTSYYVVIVGSIFGTVIVKNCFGGFGKNIFNPAIMARIFVGLCFASQMAVPELLKTAAAGIDSVSGATLTTAFNGASSWIATSRVDGLSVLRDSIFADYTLADMLLGNYVGALGETFTIVILVLGVVLSLLKVINWRTPVFYLGTVAITAFVIALVCGLDKPFTYVLYHLSLGGLVFGAVFMLTDPVTGPTSPFGKSLVAVIAGFITVLLRIKGGYPEGVMFSIALCNLISPTIDYLTVGKSSSHMTRKVCGLLATLLVAVGLCSCVSYSVNGRGDNRTHGMDKPVYELLNEKLSLNDGDYLVAVDNYVAKTNRVKAYKEGNQELSAVYTINNKNGEVVATAYTIYLDGVVPYDQYTMPVKSYVLVAINNDGTIYDIGVLAAINTKGYGLESAINDYIHTSYQGKNKDNYSSVDVYAGASFSSGFIKDVVAAAFAEHNA